MENIGKGTGQKRFPNLLRQWRCLGVNKLGYSSGLTYRVNESGYQAGLKIEVKYKRR